MTPRERLTKTNYDSLDSMVEAYAAEAQQAGRKQFRETLALDRASIDRLEVILNRLCPAPDPLPAEESEWLTMLWGCYFGEILRTLHGGSWTMSQYPGGDFAVPTLEIPPPSGNGSPSRLYPMLKVHRRLTLGAGESLPAFYDMVAKRLDAAAAQPPDGQASGQQ